MLEFDDIQHILLTRTPAMTGRYEFLSFDNPAGGRAWLSELIPVVESAATAQASMDSTKRWVTLAFTWNGLRALGVPEESLATFPEEFRQGMAARADILGDTGADPPRQLGRRAGRRRLARDRDPVRPRRRRTCAGHRGTRRAGGPVRRCAEAVVSGFERDAAVQLRP